MLWFYPSMLSQRGMPLEEGESALFGKPFGRSFIIVTWAFFFLLSRLSCRYPLGVVPLGVQENGEPFGFCFLGRKWSEPTLIALM
jgi:hypothetical protein